jgi:predicted transcriptional regulator
VQKLTVGIKSVSETGEAAGTPPAPAVDPKKAIRDKSIDCLECGKRFKVITQKHLATHGLTPSEYKEKWGYPKSQALVCKSLQRERRKKMKEMQLWKKRKKAS